MSLRTRTSSLPQVSKPNVRSRIPISRVPQPRETRMATIWRLAKPARIAAALRVAQSRNGRLVTCNHLRPAGRSPFGVRLRGPSREVQRAIFGPTRVVRTAWKTRAVSFAAGCGFDTSALDVSGQCARSEPQTDPP
jgi:hypothetical protein